MPTGREEKKSRAQPGNLGSSPTPAEEREGRSAVLLDPDPSWLGVVEQTLARLGIEVVGTALEPADALVLILEHTPDLFVIDTRTRGGEMDSLACLQRARKEAPQLKAIVLSDHNDHEHIQAALHAGASAYIAKPTNPGDFATVIRQVFKRSIFPAADAAVVEESERSSVVDDWEGLTPRELEVLRHVAEGRSNAEVAKILWVTEQTIKFHLSNVYRKLGVANRTHACRRAQTLGLLSDPEAGGGRNVSTA
jgi:DNA-binding NarL/FixJ family response regulator